MPGHAILSALRVEARMGVVVHRLIGITRSQSVSRSGEQAAGPCRTLAISHGCVGLAARWHNGRASHLRSGGREFDPRPRRACVHINLYSPKNGSNTKTQQYKHKYKQSENNDHHSIVDTLYWSIDSMEYILGKLFTPMCLDAVCIRYRVGNESALIQLRQYRFPGLAIFNAKI